MGRRGARIFCRFYKMFLSRLSADSFTPRRRDPRQRTLVLSSIDAAKSQLSLAVSDTKRLQPVVNAIQNNAAAVVGVMLKRFGCHPKPPEEQEAKALAERAEALQARISREVQTLKDQLVKAERTAYAGATTVRRAHSALCWGRDIGETKQQGQLALQRMAAEVTSFWLGLTQLHGLVAELHAVQHRSNVLHRSVIAKYA